MEYCRICGERLTEEQVKSAEDMPLCHQHFMLWCADETEEEQISLQYSTLKRLVKHYQITVDTDHARSEYTFNVFGEKIAKIMSAIDEGKVKIRKSFEGFVEEEDMWLLFIPKTKYNACKYCTWNDDTNPGACANCPH